jgi:hypothetical protein
MPPPNLTMTNLTISTSSKCPPTALYGARWIVFKTVMEGWMHADRPDGIHSLMQSIVEWTPAKIDEKSDDTIESYAVIKEQSQNTRLLLVNFLQPQLNWIYREFQALLGEHANIALDPLPLASFAKSARGVVSQFTQMIDLQTSFAKKVRNDTLSLNDSFDELTTDQLHLVTWANNVLFDIDQITPYIAAHLNEIQMFLDEMALTEILNA